MLMASRAPAAAMPLRFLVLLQNAKSTDAAEIMIVVRRRLSVAFAERDMLAAYLRRKWNRLC